MKLNSKIFLNITFLAYKLLSTLNVISGYSSKNEMCDPLFFTNPLFKSLYNKYSSTILNVLFQFYVDFQNINLEIFRIWNRCWGESSLILIIFCISVYQVLWSMRQSATVPYHYWEFHMQLQLIPKLVTTSYQKVSMQLGLGGGFTIHVIGRVVPFSRIK